MDNLIICDSLDAMNYEEELKITNLCSGSLSDSVLRHFVDTKLFFARRISIVITGMTLAVLAAIDRPVLPLSILFELIHMCLESLFVL